MDNTKWYLVSFFRKDEKGNKGAEYLGSVEVSDSGTGQHFTIQAKAFRQAPPKCLYADRVTVQPI